MHMYHYNGHFTRVDHDCTLRLFLCVSMKGVLEHEHRPGVFFYPVGLSDKKEVDTRGWNMDSLKGILTRFGDQDVRINIEMARKPKLVITIDFSSVTSLCIQQ